MDALQPLGIEKAGGIADDKCAVDSISRHGIPAAVRERLCTVTYELAAFENLFDVRMGLPLLKSRMRIELRVGIFEREDQPNRNAIVGKAVNPATTIHVRGDW